MTTKPPASFSRRSLLSILGLGVASAALSAAPALASAPSVAPRQEPPRPAPSPERLAAKVCQNPNCGAINPDAALFCGHCLVGFKLRSEAPRAPQPQRREA